ncbi:MAG TPA: hypothetical protein VIA06_01085 [Candidatus Dormibacteraeota bacterium]|nr:hypothetical protein [Candidatus Dormibacteraeota bacterium]
MATSIWRSVRDTRTRFRFAGTSRRPVWPAAGGFAALGAELAAGLRSDVRRWQAGPTREARTELLLEVIRRMAGQMALGPCGGHFVDGVAISGRKRVRVRRQSGVWTAELSRSLAEEGGASLSELVASLLGAVQEVLREEWSEPPGGLVRRRGVDWQLVRSWSAACWREHDVAEAAAAYLSGFRSTMRETAPRVEPLTARLLMI